MRKAQAYATMKSAKSLILFGFWQFLYVKCSMKNIEIIRDESGRFVLRHWYGRGDNRHCTDIELHRDIDEAKKRAIDWLSRLREEDFPADLRPALIDSIKECLPIPKTFLGIIADRSHRARMLPGSINYPPISSTVDF